MFAPLTLMDAEFPAHNELLVVDIIGKGLTVMVVVVILEHPFASVPVMV